MRCPTCGFEIDQPNLDRCPNCGNRLPTQVGQAAPPTAENPPPPPYDPYPHYAQYAPPSGYGQPGGYSHTPDIA